jgi:hypothetical protein
MVSMKKQLKRREQEMRKKLSKLFLYILTIILLVTVVYAQEAIQTQLSSDGSINASLIEAKVKRGVLTVKVILKNISNQGIEPEIAFGKAYYTDIEANKKYFALKDADGKFIAGPAGYDWGGGTFKERIAVNNKQILWIKFPAPPDTTTKIDIFIPKILPFEDISIQR